MGVQTGMSMRSLRGLQDGERFDVSMGFEVLASTVRRKTAS